MRASGGFDGGEGGFEVAAVEDEQAPPRVTGCEVVKPTVQGVRR